MVQDGDYVLGGAGGSGVVIIRFLTSGNDYDVEEIGLMPSLQSGSVGGWHEVGRTTLGSANADVVVSSLADKKYYMILGNPTLSGSSGDFFVRSNGDTGGNYCWNKKQNNDTPSVEHSNSNGVSWGKSHKPNGAFLVGYLANKSDKEKLMILNGVQGDSTGTGNIPWRTTGVGKHVQTSRPNR